MVLADGRVPFPPAAIAAARRRGPPAHRLRSPARRRPTPERYSGAAALIATPRTRRETMSISMPTTTEARSEKSTTVRATSIPRSLRLVRRGVHALERLSPPLADLWLERL